MTNATAWCMALLTKSQIRRELMRLAWRLEMELLHLISSVFLCRGGSLVWRSWTTRCMQMASTSLASPRVESSQDTFFSTVLLESESPTSSLLAVLMGASQASPSAATVSTALLLSGWLTELYTGVSHRSFRSQVITEILKTWILISLAASSFQKPTTRFPLRMKSSSKELPIWSTWNS